MMINDDVLAGNETLHQLYELSVHELAFSSVTINALVYCKKLYENNCVIQFYRDQISLFQS